VGFSTDGCYDVCIEDHPSYKPEIDADYHPDGTTWVVVNDATDAPRRLELYSGCGPCRLIENLPEDSQDKQAVAWSPDRTRIAYAYRDRGFSPSKAMLKIRTAPTCSDSGTVVASIEIASGVSPGGVAWSRDSALVAVANGEGLVRIYNRDGGTEGVPVTNLILEVQYAGSLAWSHDGQYLAVHPNYRPVSVFDTLTGVEVIRCNGPTGDDTDTDDLAWLSDRLVLVTTGQFAGPIRVFAPFDGTEPELSVSSPAPGTITDAGSIAVTGYAIDETGLFPGSLRWRIDGGGWETTSIAQDGQFEVDVTLSLGLHTIQLELTDLAGNIDTESLVVERVPPAGIVVWLGETEIADGQGVPVDFGIVEQCLAGTTRAFTVCNTGGMPLTLGPIDLATGYSLAGEFPVTIGAGQCGVFTARLDAGIAGTWVGEISFATNVPDHNPFNYPVTGTVLPGEVEIVANPSDQTTCEGGAAEFCVEAAGTPPLEFQWQRDGADIPGATDPCYTTAQAGEYRCVVGNGCGSLLSGSATLTVEARPAISQQPLSQVACEGGAVTFSVAAGGTVPLSYQWRKYGQPIAGGTGATYTINPVGPGDTGVYDVVIANECGMVISNAATLTVCGAVPSIEDQPDDAAVCAGDSATFIVQGAGCGPLAYQWHKDGEPVGGNTPALGLENVQPADDGAQITCLVTDDCGAAVSDAAALAVNTPPSIMDDPDSETICAGESHEFCVSAGGTVPLSYQWRRSGSDIPDATSSCYVATEAGSYDCVVSNACGSDTSAAATLTINMPPSVTHGPDSATICQGQSHEFCVSAGGTAPLGYQWRRNSLDIPDATSSCYVATQAGLYDCFVSNACGSDTSAAATLTVEVALRWYRDADGDGYGDAAQYVDQCDQPADYVANDDDCDDGCATCHPGAAEVCDGVDNDCDGQIDEGGVCDQPDSDGDGDPDDTDCDDSDGSIHHAATEVCDGVDNDCDGQIDEGGVCDEPDSDGDGDPDDTDCNDSDPRIHHGATEVCDGRDNDCNGQVDEDGVCDQPDSDGDGESDMTDCNASDPAIHHGATEVCDGVDNDCDGQVDEGGVCDEPDSDGDGDPDPTDCNDSDPRIHHGATEVCDGRDNDCDGQVDEGGACDQPRTWYRDADGDGYGNPSVTTQAVQQPVGYVLTDDDCDDSDADVNPAATELCNEIDDDCDGEIDEGGVCDNGQSGQGQPGGLCPVVATILLAVPCVGLARSRRSRRDVGTDMNQ